MDSMKNESLEEGDTVVITKGSYMGATFTNLTGITIVPQEPGVTFNGRVVIGHDKKVTFDGTAPVAATDSTTTTLPADKPAEETKAEESKAKEPTYGYTFSGFNGEAFAPTGNCQDCTIKGVQCLNIGTFLNGSGNTITYKGTPDTALFYNLTADTIKVTGGCGVYNGTWDATTTYHNVNIGMTLKNVVVLNDGTGSATKVLGCSLYKMVADNWRITGPTLVDIGDTGIFNIIGGNVTLKNIYRNGGWAYIMRLINVGLGEVGESYMYNIIDVNSVNYGTVDNRVEAGLCKLEGEIPLLGGNLHVYNVTAGNKTTMTHYLTCMVVLGNTKDGKGTQYNTEIKNCFVFNTVQGKDDKGMSGILQINAEPGVHFTKDHNLEVVGPVPDSYFIDQDKFYPRSGSPLIGKGEAIPMVTTDIYGNPRTDPPCVGAVEHVEGMPEPEPNPDAPKIADARLSTNDWCLASTNTAPVPYRVKK